MIIRLKRYLRMIRAYEIIKKICKFEEVTLADMSELDQYKLLGILCTHRCEGFACYSLKKTGQVNLFSEEFTDTLETLYERNIKEQKAFSLAMEHVKTILKDVKAGCAFTNGAALQAIYPEGVRRCRYIDILVEKKGVGEVIHTLTNNGFMQGEIRGDQNKIYFTKQVDWDELKYIKVALFSGIKNSKGQEITNKMLSGSKAVIGTNGQVLAAFDDVDIFIHLCMELYKGAITYKSVVYGRELLLHKFVDIVAYFKTRIKQENISRLLDAIAEYNVGDAVCYSLYGAEMLLETGDKDILDVLNAVNVKKDNLLKYVYDSENKQKYKYSDFFIYRVFDEKHANNLVLQ